MRRIAFIIFWVVLLPWLAWGHVRLEAASPLKTGFVDSLTYTYDLLNRLSNAVDSTVGTAIYGYDGVGNLKTATYPNGVTNTYIYDSLNRLTNLAGTTNNGTLATFKYKLGAAGNRTNLVETVSGLNRTNNWFHDALYRLTNEVLIGAAPAGTNAYRYDAVGNRTNRTVIGTGLTNQNFTYNTNDWLTGDVYDSNGSTRTNGPNIFFYDVENHLTNATVAGTTVAYAYTADGIRVSKTIAGTTTLYLVDDRNPSGYAQVLEELTVTGGTTNLSKVFTYGLDLIAQRDAGTRARSFYGYDGNGNTRYLTGTNGAITDTYLYDAFGSLLTSTGSTANDYRYTGEQYDSTLGLYYLRARYVNPGIARFSTRDSYFGNPEYPLSLHKYLYCHDNPINMTDPVGSYSTYRQYYGYAVEDAIQDFYEEDHPGEKPILKSKRVFRKDTPAQWLFPDVFDPNRNKWLEVKPLSVPGVATGEAKRALNMMALPGDPELLWQPPLLLHIVPTGETFVSVNIAGVVYYQREDLVQAELLTAVASGVAYSAKDLLKYVSVQAGKALIQGSVRPVLSYTSSLALQGKAADYSRGQIMTSIAGLTTLMIGF